MKDLVNMMEQVYKTVKPVALKIFELLGLEELTSKSAKGWLGFVTALLTIKSAIIALVAPGIGGILLTIFGILLTYRALRAYLDDTGKEIEIVKVTQDTDEDILMIYLSDGTTKLVTWQAPKRNAVSVSNNLDSSITVKYDDGETTTVTLR